MKVNKKTIAKNKWYIIIVVIIIISVVGIGLLLLVDTTISPSISYTWEDHSSGELTVVRGAYKGKTETFYFHDDQISDYNSLSVSFGDIISGSVSFYFQYENDDNGEISLDFYSEGQIFSTLENAQDGVMSETWCSVILKFDCTTDTGEVWIDGVLTHEGDFTENEVDYCDGFVIRTSMSGRIDGYISGLSIS